MMELYYSAIRNGQIDLIEQDLRSKKLNPNIKDKEGKYSLLQKAVYYNRRHLVTTLLDSGADLMFSSGDDADDNLQESSLLIAIKEKYYGIVELLTNFNRSILNTLSKNGMTCLEVTFKLKDYNAMLLLLNLGADPNMCNKDGCPVLLSILKNDTSHEVMPFILLLLRYKANPSKCDDEGNNAFHILALDKKTNLYLAFELFRASPGGAQMRNGFQDQIPYDLCSINGNVKMGRFFFDALFFSRTPFLFPSILMGSFLCITFEALHRWGYLYACLFAFFMSMLLKPLMQSSIICYRDRSDMGVSLGFTIAWIVSFIRDLSPHISSTLYDLISIFAIITMLFTCIFLRKSPEHGKSEVDQKEIIRRIVSLSPIEGPRAEQIQSIPQKPLFACTTCLTNALDSYQYVSHCKSCRECIINKDVHVTFLGNCSGQGNKRVFVLFTISSIVTFALYLQASFVTYRSFCPDAKGMLWNIIALESCVAVSHPDLFWLGLMAFVSLFFFGSLLIQELRYISLNSSISHASFVNLVNNHQLRRDVLDSVSTSLCIQRICYFFLSGRHSVSAHLTSSTNKKQSYIGADAEDSDSELVALEVHSDLPGSEIYESRIGFAGTVDYADDEEREERQHGRECNNPSHNHHHGDHGHYDSAVVSRTDTEPLLFNMSDR